MLINNPNRNVILRRASLGAACLIAAAGLYAAIDAVEPPAHGLALKLDGRAVERGPIESASYAPVSSASRRASSR